MSGYTNLPETKLAITEKLSLQSSHNLMIRKINALIDKINFLDEHINFLYTRSRTQYNTLVEQGKGLQNVYDELQEFKKRFETFENQRTKIISLESKSTTLDLIEHQDNN